MITNSYYIITFDTTSDVMRADTIIKKHVQTAIMPIPQEISSGCGLALRLLGMDENFLKSYLKTFPISGTLYHMGVQKEKGHYPVRQVMIFPC